MKPETFREQDKQSTIERTIRCLQEINITDINFVTERGKMLHNTSTGPLTTLFCANLLSRLRSLQSKMKKKGLSNSGKMHFSISGHVTLGVIR